MIVGIIGLIILLESAFIMYYARNKIMVKINEDIDMMKQEKNRG